MTTNNYEEGISIMLELLEGPTEDIKVPATSVYPGDLILMSSYEYADDTTRQREMRFWVRRRRPGATS